MNDKQIDSFIKIVNSGSFSKAAKDNYISVAAIIEQIDRLEEDLGFTLFERTNKGIILTEDGKIFYDATKKIKQIYNDAINQIKNNNKQIKIGINFGQYPTFLMEAYKKYLKRYPDISLEFIELPYNEQLDALKNKKIDITVIAKPKKAELDNLVYKKLKDDAYSFAMSEFHPLAKKKIIKKEDLKDIKILCATYKYMEYPFEKMLKDTSAILSIIDSEYTLDLKAKAKYLDSILVFHSLWANGYEPMLKVIKSDIYAGDIGVVCRKENDENIKRFINIIDI